MQSLTWASCCLLAALLLVGCRANEGQAAPGQQEGGDSAETPAAQDQGCSEVENAIDRIVCYADRATETGDLAACDAATEEGVRYQCYAIVAERRETPDPCRKIPQTEEYQDVRDLCLSDVAPLAKEAELCEEIKEPNFRDSCLLKVFRETGDETLCAEIKDAGLKSLCTGEAVQVGP